MMTHTPGKWKSTFTATGGNRGVRAEGGFICFLIKPSRYSGQDERYEKELEENKANAHLIAAAPDRLAALKEIAKMGGAYSRDPLTHAENVIENLTNIANKAIAKAEGE